MNNKELKQLLEDMTLSEKIEQLIQLNGDFFGGAGVLTGPAAQFKLTPEQPYRTGSVLSETGAENIHKLQDKFMAAQPHHIPAMFMADVIHGYRTGFPVPIALGSAFDPKVAEITADIAAKEASAAGLHVTFSPMADLSIDCRWGRCMESTGEDTWLNARYAESMVKGFQGDNCGEKGKIASCVKHFAAYGTVQSGRDYNVSELCERTLYEDHLPSYKAAIDAGAEMVMTSFNTIDRVPCTVNKRLMRDILRDKLGFDGVLITDYNAIGEAYNHGGTEDKKQAAERAIKAGCDIDMVSECYISYLEELVNEKAVDIALVDEAVMRVLELKNKLGLFENPYKDGSVEAEQSIHFCEEHRKAARRISEECIVMLKNEGILPVSEKEKILVIGSLADDKEITGTWALFVDKAQTVTLRQAVCELYPDADVTFMTYDKADNEMLAAAEAADKVIVCLGENQWGTGESRCKTDISLSAEHTELFNSIYEKNKNIVTVLFGGRPLALPDIAVKTKGLIEAWLPGSLGCYALADILFGTVNPSGRLSMSLPYSTGQLPISYRAFNSGRPKPQVDEFIPFVSNYMDAPNTPLYPFGSGMSYSDFEYSPVRLSSDRLKRNENIIASVTVTNKGERDGKEPVQMYIRDCKGSVARPMKELKGLKKIFLRSGESTEVSFEITEDMLRFYDIDMNFIAEKGDFIIWIGGTSLTDNKAEFKLI